MFAGKCDVNREAMAAELNWSTVLWKKKLADEGKYNIHRAQTRRSTVSEARSTAMIVLFSTSRRLLTISMP